MNDSADQDEAQEAAPREGWWRRLSGGLKRTSASIGGAISDIVTKRRLDADVIEELEEVLIRADLGVQTAAAVADKVSEGRYNKSVTPDEVKAILAGAVEQ
ncbi:MAG: signal recognition particle receptor subunit alpha, partial [Rhodoplanes sp.]